MSRPRRCPAPAASARSRAVLASSRSQLPTPCEQNTVIAPESGRADGRASVPSRAAPRCRTSSQPRAPSATAVRRSPLCARARSRSSVKTAAARANRSVSASRRSAWLEPGQHDVRAQPDAGAPDHRVAGLGRRGHHVRPGHRVRDRGHRCGGQAQAVADLGREAFRALARPAPHQQPADRPDPRYRLHLGPGLVAGADTGEGDGPRPGQRVGRHAAGRVGAQAGQRLARHHRAQPLVPVEHQRPVRAHAAGHVDGRPVPRPRGVAARAFRSLPGLALPGLAFRACRALGALAFRACRALRGRPLSRHATRRPHRPHWTRWPYRPHGPRA